MSYSFRYIVFPLSYIKSEEKYNGFVHRPLYCCKRLFEVHESSIREKTSRETIESQSTNKNYDAFIAFLTADSF